MRKRAPALEQRAARAVPAVAQAEQERPVVQESEAQQVPAVARAEQERPVMQEPAAQEVPERRAPQELVPASEMSQAPGVEPDEEAPVEAAEVAAVPHRGDLV